MYQHCAGLTRHQNGDQKRPGTEIGGHAAHIERGHREENKSECEQESRVDLFGEIGVHA